MTAVRTTYEAGCFAVTASSQKILILDRFKKLTVATVDNFAPLFSAMSVAPEKFIGVEHLMNASIIFAMSNELGITPGLFEAGDNALIEFCRSQISDQVDPADHDLLIKELISSWQLIAAHPLLKKYIQLGEYLKADTLNCTFTPIGAFEIFIHDYFAGFVKSYVYQCATEFVLLKRFTYLLFATLDGVCLYENRFLETELFFEKISKILNETGQRREQVEAFLAKSKQDHDIFKSMWFIAIRDWAKIELEDIEKQDGVNQALTDLLENQQSTGLGIELEEQLNELRTYINVPDGEVSPLMKTCDFSHVSNDVVVLNKLTKEAIAYAIVSYSRENGISLYPQLLVKPFPVYRLAGKGAFAEEELTALLLDTDNPVNLSPFELYAILSKARSPVLKEVVQEAISARAKQEEFFCTFHRFGQLSITSFAVIQAARFNASAMTFQYRRLNDLVSGPKVSIDRQSVEDDSPPTPRLENPEDALHEALNLQGPGGCSVQ